MNDVKRRAMLQSRAGASVPDEAARSSWRPDLQELHAHWCAVAPAGRLPGRQHFDPTAVPRLLHRLALFEIERDPLRLRFRLAGTTFRDALGYDPTGKLVGDAIERSPKRTAALARYWGVAESGVPNWRRGPPYLAVDPKYAEVENVILPLARDGVTVDMLMLGAVYYWRSGRELACIGG